MSAFVLKLSTKNTKVDSSVSGQSIFSVICYFTSFRVWVQFWKVWINTDFVGVDFLVSVSSSMLQSNHNFIEKGIVISLVRFVSLVYKVADGVER